MSHDKDLEYFKFEITDEEILERGRRMLEGLLNESR